MTGSQGRWGELRNRKVQLVGQTRGQRDVEWERSPPSGEFLIGESAGSRIGNHGKLGKDGEERGVWNFTLRDSPTDTINVTYWGSAIGSKKSYETFGVGDVVEIMHARISFKQSGNSDSTFTPSVSSLFQLQLQENNSILLPYEGEDADYYRNLIFIPTKPPADFLRLSDILSYGQAMKGDYINLLVAIRNVGEIRSVRSKKDSKDLLCRDILVMDQSHLEFQITLWSEDVIKRANFWHPRQTVIFCADIRVDWNDFRQSITAVITARTIITENPNIAEAQILRKYAAAFPLQPIAVLDHFTKFVKDPDTINTVMTTAQIMNKAYRSDAADNKFTALVYAVVTSLDIDGSENPITYRCSMCSQFLEESSKCYNQECMQVATNHPTTVIPIYNLKVHLTDHRGSLYNCRLISPAADETLNCSVETYLRMSTPAKTELKWQLLLSRCEIRLLVLCTSPERPHPLFSLLTCKKVNPVEVASKLPVY